MTDATSRLARCAALALALGAAGTARAADGIIYSGSAFVDFWSVPDGAARERATDGMVPAASIRLGMDVNDDLSFQAKACVGCHGFDFETVSLDYQPKLWLNVQFGRITVPFGDFSNRVDPGSHRTGSAPLVYDMGRMAYGGRSGMNLGVLPLPYVDTGALVYGVRWLAERVQLWYGVYGVAGLRGSNDLEWTLMRRAPYEDNNRLPSGGGRVTLSWSADPGAFFGDASLGASYTGGRYDDDATREYHAWAADATFRLGKLVLRGEYAARRTDLDTAVTGYPYAVVDPWLEKSGFYAEAEAPLGPYLSAVYRYDALRRSGAPLPGADAQLTPDSEIGRHTAGVVVTPATSLFLKLSWELWRTSDFGDFHTYHAGLGGAF